jgi:RHS repeat-associated protein
VNEACHGDFDCIFDAAKLSAVAARQAAKSFRIYDGKRAIQERNVSNTPTVAYTRGNDLSGTLEGAGGIGGLLARLDSYSSGSFSDHNYYHADGNGNIAYLVNSSQTLAASYRYDAYGNVLSSSGSYAASNTYQFSSKEWMSSVGLYYYLYRFYAPSLQRWPNRDPFTEPGFETERGLSLDYLPQVEILEGANLYCFEYNQPTDWIDPLGNGGAHTRGPGSPPLPCPCPPGQHVMSRAQAYGGTLACVRHMLTSTLTGFGLGAVTTGIGGTVGGTIGADGATGVTVGGVVGTGGGILVGVGAAMSAAALYCNMTYVCQ